MMTKNICMTVIAFLCIFLISSCTKDHSMYPPREVSGKFVMIPKSDRFKLHDHIVKAYLYELRDGEYLSYETCITGHIPYEFRSYDTINIKATMILVAPDFELFYLDSTSSPSIYRLENIKKY